MRAGRGVAQSFAFKLCGSSPEKGSSRAEYRTGQSTDSACRHLGPARNRSGSRHHAVVDTVRAIRWLEPRVTAQVVVHAVDAGVGAAGRQRGNDFACRVRHVGRGCIHTGGHTRVVGVRRGGGGGGCARRVTRRLGVGSGGAGVGRGYGCADCDACHTGRERPTAAVIAP